VHAWPELYYCLLDILVPKFRYFSTYQLARVHAWRPQDILLARVHAWRPQDILLARVHAWRPQDNKTLDLY
jgi:hypothetical protein